MVEAGGTQVTAGASNSGVAATTTSDQAGTATGPLVPSACLLRLHQQGPVQPLPPRGMLPDGPAMAERQREEQGRYTSDCGDNTPA